MSTATSTTGEAPRLAIDGPVTPRTGPFRHTHPPRSRRRAEELGIDLASVDGTGPAGRVTVADVERAATTPSAGPPAPGSAPSTAPPPTGRAPGSATDTWSTRRLDVGAIVASTAHVTGAGAFEHVLHRVVLLLPQLLAGVTDRPLVVAVERAHGTAVVDGPHALSLEGLLGRLAATHTGEAAPTATVRDGSLRGAASEVPPRTSGAVVAVAIGAVEEQLVVTRDRDGYQQVLLRPTCELTVRFDADVLQSTALRRFLDALQDRLGTAA